MEPKVEIIFSRDGKLYYVVNLDHFMPRDWVSVEKSAEGKYDVLPFAMYEVKSGVREERPESDPLVKRYAQAEKWPTRDSEEWRKEIGEARDRAETQRVEAEGKVAFWVQELARLDAIIGAHWS